MREIEARAAAYLRDDDLEAEVVAFAEGEQGEGRRLELQRSTSPTDEDRRLGMDTHCVITDMGATHYGAVAAWSLTGTKLRLLLTPQAAEALEVEEGYLITLAGPAAEARETIERGLAAVLDGDASGEPSP